MSDGTYKLEDLARAAGTSPRTVRYYVQRGLIPAPAFKGKDTAYAHEHLVRLRAIRRLQEAFFPLDAIAVELGRRSLSELEQLADGRETPSPVPVVASLSEERQKLDPDASVERAAAVSNGSERVFRRVELAPGVELSVADDAPHESKRIAQSILRAHGVSRP